MPITMQGTWFVQVKSKSASFPQRYIISGATSGNGVYNGVTTTPEVMVTGDSWNISIQNDPGSGFLNSKMKLKFPQVIGGEYRFDLESNDAGGDADFNDLILTFRTPVTDQDYIVYGNISYYKGCLLNPCYRIIVVDTWLKLKQVVVNKDIREAIQTNYPDLVQQVMANPESDPEIFKPIVVPLTGELPIPTKEEVMTISEAAKISLKPKGKSKTKAITHTFNALKSAEARVSNDASAQAGLATANRAALVEAAKVVDRFKLYCETGPIPHALLRFEEYDRTTAELSGGSYTGEGIRENLGEINTDFLGNYIFRFHRSTTDLLNEVGVDVAAGENVSVQSRPDMIVQLLDQFDLNTSLFETAPYWNIPFIRRIDICIPKEKSGLIPVACQGQHIIQGVGNVALADEVAGTRVGFNNYLNSSGLITAFDSIAPAARCAAWHGNLLLRGCLKNPQIKYYTIESRKGLFGAWTAFTQSLRLPKFIGSLKISALVNRTFGPAGSPIEGYLNVETDSGQWLEAFENIKARIVTSAFDNGLHQFRIQGYRANGTKFAGTTETIRLYLHNSSVIRTIDQNVTVGGATLGNCALFTLPVDGSNNIIEDAPMTIRFKVEHNPGSSPFGFINQYALSLSKGATGGFGVDVPVVDANFVALGQLDGVINRGRNYLHIDNLNCNTRFKGTVNEVSADASGFYTVTVKPASGRWLEPDQKFCAFGIRLGGTLRLTNGSSGYPDFHATSVLIGIEKPEL